MILTHFSSRIILEAGLAASAPAAQRPAPSATTTSVFYGSDESEPEYDEPPPLEDMALLQDISDSDDEDFVDAPARSGSRRSRPSRRPRRGEEPQQDGESDGNSSHASSEDEDDEDDEDDEVERPARRRSRPTARAAARWRRRARVASDDDEDNAASRGDDGSDDTEEDAVMSSSSDDEERERRRQQRRPRQNHRGRAETVTVRSQFVDWPDEYSNVWEWISAEEATAAFVPQVGDDVWYCRQGQAELLENSAAAPVMRQRGLPWETIPDIGPMEKGRIVSACSKLCVYLCAHCGRP